MRVEKTMSMRGLAELERQMRAQDKEIVQLVGRFSLMSSGQIRRVCFQEIVNPRSRQRRANEALTRLTEQEVLARLVRRIGGQRSGSEGYSYRLGPYGQRLVQIWAGQTPERGRLRPEPGERFVRHRLAVSELYVRLVEAARVDRGDDLEVIAYEAEPDSWRPFDGYGATERMLKPDAFLRLGVGELEHWWFCELDLGTVSRRARESQAAAYRAYWRSGAAGEVMPRVLWVTPNDLVSRVASTAINPAGNASALFVVTTLDRAIEAAATAQPQVRP